MFHERNRKNSREQFCCDDRVVAKIQRQLKNDEWYRKTLNRSEMMLDQCQMEQLIRDSYEILAPVLCEFVVGVQSSLPDYTKICPFRSGEIYWQIAREIFPPSIRNQWYCFDYPRDLRYKTDKRSTDTKYGWWLKSRDVINHVLSPSRVVLVDLGFEGSVYEVFHAARLRSVSPRSVRKQTKASFIFSTQKGVTRIGDDLDYQVLLPTDHDKITEEELLEDPITNGKINLAQVIHDATRGCYAPIQLSPNVKDTMISGGTVSRLLHPKPWIYARNYLVTEAILEYARNNKKILGSSAVAQQGSENTAIEWASQLSEVDLRLFTLIDWKSEVVYLPNSTSNEHM